MNSFKDVALQILEEAGKPLHVKTITSIALERGWLKTAGKTPEATMGAQLIVDVNKNGEGSRFIKTGPATFTKNPNIYIEPQNIALGLTTYHPEISITRRKAINDALSSRQKSDITEARIAELISLYGRPDLPAISLYRMMRA